MKHTKMGDLVARSIEHEELSAEIRQEISRRVDDVGAGLSPQAFRVLRASVRGGSTGEVGCEGGVSRASMSRIMRNLIRRNLVTTTKDGGDKNYTYVHATDEGRTLVALIEKGNGHG